MSDSTQSAFSALAHLAMSTPLGRYTRIAHTKKEGILPSSSLCSGDIPIKQFNHIALSKLQTSCSLQVIGPFVSRLNYTPLYQAIESGSTDIQSLQNLWCGQHSFFGSFGNRGRFLFWALVNNIVNFNALGKIKANPVIFSCSRLLFGSRRLNNLHGWNNLLVLQPLYPRILFTVIPMRSEMRKETLVSVNSHAHICHFIGSRISKSVDEVHWNSLSASALSDVDLFLFFFGDRRSQLIDIRLSPNWVELPSQVGVIVRRLYTRLFDPSIKRSTAHVQAFHRLLCGQRLLGSLCHDYLTFHFETLYSLDFQYVNKYNWFRVSDSTELTVVCFILYTMLRRVDNVDEKKSACFSGYGAKKIALNRGQLKIVYLLLCAYQALCSRLRCPRLYYSLRICLNQANLFNLTTIRSNGSDLFKPTTIRSICFNSHRQIESTDARKVIASMYGLSPIFPQSGPTSPACQPHYFAVEVAA